MPQALLAQFDAQETVELLWCLVNLRAKPEEEWMDALVAGVHCITVRESGGCAGSTRNVDVAASCMK